MTLAISVAALAVALATLWLTQLRRASLSVSAPKAWAGIVRPDQIIVLLPLAFENAGARSGVVRDLRLAFLDEEDSPLEFVRTRPQLRPTQEDSPRFAEPFAVPGQSAQVHFCEFQRKPGRTPEAGTWTLRIDGQTSGRRAGWRPLLTFEFAITPKQVDNLNTFIARDNPAQRDFDSGLG